MAREKFRRKKLPALKIANLENGSVPMNSRNVLLTLKGKKSEICTVNSIRLPNVFMSSNVWVMMMVPGRHLTVWFP